MRDKRLPAETGLVILLPVKRLGRSRIMQTVSAGSHCVAGGSLGRKQEIVDSLGKPNMTLEQEAKISRLVYILWGF